MKSFKPKKIRLTLSLVKEILRVATPADEGDREIILHSELSGLYVEFNDPCANESGYVGPLAENGCYDGHTCAWEPAVQTEDDIPF